MKIGEMVLIPTPCKIEDKMILNNRKGQFKVSFNFIDRNSI